MRQLEADILEANEAAVKLGKKVVMKIYLTPKIDPTNAQPLKD